MHVENKLIVPFFVSLITIIKCNAKILREI